MSVVYRTQHLHNYVITAGFAGHVFIPIHFTSMQVVSDCYTNSFIGVFKEKEKQKQGELNQGPVLLSKREIGHAKIRKKISLLDSKHQSEFT